MDNKVNRIEVQALKPKDAKDNKVLEQQSKTLGYKHKLKAKYGKK